MSEIDPQESIEREIAELERREAELRAKKSELLTKQRELEKIREANKPVSVVFYEFKDGYLKCGSDYRTDLVDVQKSIPTRTFIPPRTNSFHASRVPLLLERMGKLLNVSVEWRDGVREAYEAYVNRPDYAISLEPNAFKIELPTGADTFPVSTITGAIYFRATLTHPLCYRIPLPEGWRIVDALADKGRIDITPEAREFIEKQIKERSALDEIAKLKDTEYDPQFLDGNTLRPFQRVGAKYIETVGRGILADQMGLGKTWQALAVAKKNNWTTVVLCPASLKINWAREIFKLTGERPAVFQGSTPNKIDIEELLIKRPKFSIFNYDIIGRKVDEHVETKDTEGYLHVQEKERWLWVELINVFKPDLIVLDEAHYIKNLGSQRSRASRLLNAPRILAMTGTPVLNRPEELWPILNILDKKAFPESEDFMRRYSDGRNGVRNVDELREIMKSKMIRRLKKDVISDLPPVSRINEYHELSAKARKLYNRVLDGVYTLLNEWVPGSAGYEKAVPNILVQIMRMKQICAYDKMDRTAEIATEIYDGVRDENGNAKWKKVIIFSQFVSAVHGIEKRLGGEAVAITGEQEQWERMKLVDQFQTDPSVHFAVCSTKAVSEGLTMTAAGSVIFNDQMWTPAAHEQAEGRAYGRLNDAHEIDSYWVVAENTIETYILETLAAKMNMIDKVVEGYEKIRDTSIAMDLIQKLKDRLI